MYKLYNGDCLEIMDSLIEEGVKVDCILTDPPYGTTACKWDTVIPFNCMWERLNKLIKPNGAIVLFGSEPFSSTLRMSNIKKYKYDWVWDKHIPRNFINAKIMPMQKHENIIVFNCNGKLNYHPIMIKRDKPVKVKNYSKKNTDSVYNLNNMGSDNLERTYDYKYPDTIIVGKWEANKGKLHPTQKPVSLMEYLIKTYTNENEIVLDFTMGSGSCGVACINTNRKFIGIELDNNYFNIASKRIEEAFFNAQNKEGAINEE